VTLPSVDLLLHIMQDKHVHVSYGLTYHINNARSAATCEWFVVSIDP
jgi:hypothetical protein